MTCPHCSSSVPEGAHFCSQCGGSLAGLCPSCNAQNDASARFCSSCGTQISAGESPTTAPAATPTKEDLHYAERRQLTVLFSDLVGSTELSERIDPEDLRNVLRDYQAACTRIVDLYGGHLAKFLGDGVLAYFGYPVAHEDDALRGVRAGLGIVEAIEAIAERHRSVIGSDVTVRVGLHTGLVVVGDMGSSADLESDAIVGQTPNMAARIQSAAKENTLYISQETFHLVEGFVEHEDLGLHELKGISRPVHLYRILHESTAQSRLEATSDHLTPYAGRDDEVERLTSRWNRATDGETQIALIGGEPGVGKSRILLEVKEKVAAATGSWLTELRCSPFYQNSAMHPAIEFLERTALQFEREDDPAARIEKIEGFVAQYGLDANEAVPLLADLLLVPLDDRYPPLGMSPQKQKERTIELLVSILLERSERQPVLFILEDLHWADPSTLEMLDRLLERSDDHSILILLTYRPEFTPYWQPRPNMIRIELVGLPKSDGEEIIRTAAGGRDLPREAVDYILGKTDGIPLFLEELTKMMIDSEMFVESDTDDRLELSAPLDRLPVPATLQDSLTARLDRLPKAKPVAQLAAAIGREFTYEMLDAVPGDHRSDLRENLGRLRDAGLLFEKGAPPTATYLFKHALIQDSAYSSLLKTSRRSYHTLIAKALEERFPEVAEAQPELIALHYSKSEEPMLSVRYWLQAALKALGSSAYEEAIAHTRAGIELFETPPTDPQLSYMYVSLKLMLGGAIMARRGFVEEIEEVYTSAIDHAASMNSPLTAITISCLHSYYYGISEIDKALETAQRLLALTEETGDIAGQCFGNETTAVSHYFAGRFTESIPYFERVIELMPQADPERYAMYVMNTFHDAHQYALTMGSWSELQLGNIAKGERMCDEGLAMSRNNPHNFIKINGIFMRGAFAAFQGQYALAEELAVESIRLAEEHLIYWWIGPSTMLLAYLTAVKGDPETGYAMATSVLDIVRGAISLPHQMARFGQICLMLEKYDEALAANDEAIEYIERTSERWWESEVYRVRGLLLLGRGDRDDALEAFAKSLEVARSQQARILQVRTLLSLLDFHTDDDPSRAPYLSDLTELLPTFEGEEHPDLEKARQVVM